MAVPTREELEAAHCWESDDRVPGRQAMTAFRRAARLQQAQWRDAKGFPIGSQPIAPAAGGPRPRLVGSRIPLAYGQETGANFLSAATLDAARARTAVVERQQSFDHQRLWADLLSSAALSFNLFGALAADAARADRAVHSWWPDAPGTVSHVCFAHSPGRLDPSYLGNLMAFDTAFVLDVGGGAQGIVAVDVKYHERVKPHLPKPARLPRYLEVTERSGVFGPAAIDAVNGTVLLEMWLEHLLMLSMLQHPDGTWRWGRYVVVYPAGNHDFAEWCGRYRDLLVDPSTFAAVTLEELLDAGALPVKLATDTRHRYVLG